MHFKKPKSIHRLTKVSIPQPQPSGLTPIPAHCQNCGAVFAATGIIGGAGSTKITFSHCTVDCRRCGGIASILDGTFEKTSQTLKLLSGPRFTKDVLRAFGGLIEQAANKKISTEDLQKKAGDLNADLGAVVAQAIKSRWGLAFLVILLVFLKTCHFSIDAKLDVNKLWEQTFSHGAIHETPGMEGKTQGAKSGQSTDRADASPQSTRNEK